MREEYEIAVAEKRQEALDAVTLKFQIPEGLTDKFKALAGQFVGVTALINGEEVHRSYSLCSSPHQKDLEISIKKVPQGKMSTYLVEEVQVGDKLRLVPPSGHFYQESENKRHHVMFAAGSGVTPMISIISHLKEKKPQDQITLFYWNQTLKSTMFIDELTEFNKASNFNLFLGFTKEKPSHEGFCFDKRLDQSLMKDCFYKWSVSIDMPVFYLCGPEEFMSTIELFLGMKGYDESQIRKESFQPQAAAAELSDLPSENVSDGRIYIGDLNQKSEDGQGVCEAVLDGETISVEPQEDETILEAFLRDGESPPYSCMEGTCIACQCKVLEGLVSMPEGSFVSEEDVEEGLVLSCQAQIRSKKVRVDFDNF